MTSTPEGSLDAQATSEATPERPLRADAARNRQRILDAAREVFAERGLAATLNDIAHHAGVGVGTVYRRFPDKSQLIEGLFEQRIAELESRMQAALSDPNPWHGLTAFLEHALLMQANDRGLREIVTCMPGGMHRVRQIRSRLLPLGTALVRRAQAAGDLRDDIVAQDLPLIQLMLRTLIDASRDVEPELWRRYLQIVLRGLSARPDEHGLQFAPLKPEDVDRVMSSPPAPPG